MASENIQIVRTQLVRLKSNPPSSLHANTLSNPGRANCAVPFGNMDAGIVILTVVTMIITADCSEHGEFFF